MNLFKTLARRQDKGRDRPGGRAGRQREPLGLQGDDLVGLWSFLTSDFVEADLLSFMQCFAAFSNDGTEMDEEIGTGLSGDETITLVIVEPFDSAGLLFRHI